MNMTPKDAAAYRAQLHGRGICPGLARMERAMSLCGDPQRRLRVVHVAGTNGKGSTARMIQSALTVAGYRTGLYASPAVGAIEDTITVDGAPIPADTLAAMTGAWYDRQAQMGDCGELTEFELVTALTLEYFARERVDICVLECGMGGRLDATNVCPPPLAAVLTPVALDHTAFLGDTVEAIATEKCGIIKPPCRVVTSPDQSPEALAAIYACAAARGLTVRQPNRGAAALVSAAPGETVFTFAGETYTLPLGGAFQVGNALTALETLAALGECGYPVEQEALHAGLAAATLPARQEVLCRKPFCLIDGAHNPHGVAVLAETLRPLAPVTLLIGMLRDKDVAACAALLAPSAAEVVCCTPPSERAMKAEELAAVFREVSVADVRACDDPAAALTLARDLVGEKPLIVCGSFYTASAIRPLLKKAE